MNMGSQTEKKKVFRAQLSQIGNKRVHFFGLKLFRHIFHAMSLEVPIHLQSPQIYHC